MRRETILSCFAPLEGFDGDFGWVCGFTATAQVLADMADRFTAGTRRRRPSLGIFLHPPERHLPLRQGVTVLFPRRGVPLGFNLLHAKVALLSFIGRDASMLRLVVSTGNWTHDPMGSSLDLFWITEWRSDAASAAQQANDQAAADIRAASAMFSWLRPRFDTSLLELDTGNGSAERRLVDAIAGMTGGEQLAPRFIDTRREALDEQVLRMVVAERGPARRRVVMGSGYFETGEDAEVGVLTEFVARLRDAGVATKTCSVDLVLNADACQGLAAQAEELGQLGWKLRPPIHRDMPGAKLHAKFIFSASGGDWCSRPWCYIGSGNLSGIGFTRSAGAGGNLEAGVTFFPTEALRWAGVDDAAVGNRLPVDFRNETKPHSLIAGEDYRPPGTGAEPPPVSYLRWLQGALVLPEGSPDAPELTVAMPDGTWSPLPARFDEPPPVAMLGPWMAQVPVLADGGFVLPPLGPMRVEDVLQALALFPLVLPEERDREAASEVDGEEDSAASAQGGTGDYPVRRMMRLIAGLSECQANVEPRDWERWVTRIEEMLAAVTAPEAAAIAGVRACGIDPLSVLLHRPFLPNRLEIPALKRLTSALGLVRQAWQLDGTEPLFPGSEPA